jgi:hypothetical protein
MERQISALMARHAPYMVGVASTPREVWPQAMRRDDYDNEDELAFVGAAD